LLSPLPARLLSERLAEARAKIDDTPFEPKLARGLAHIVGRGAGRQKAADADRLEVSRETAKAHPIVDGGCVGRGRRGLLPHDISRGDGPLARYSLRMVDVSLLFIDFLAAEEVVTEPEAVLLRGTLRAPVPIVKSRCALRR
jgi:hypothetical protein